MLKLSSLIVIGVIVSMAAFPLTLAAQNAGNVENGKRLFLRDGCFECHGTAGQGGGAGAKIASTALNLQGVMRYVRKPSGSMPAYTDKVLSDQELTDIYAYLKTMPAKSAKDVPMLTELRDRK